MAVLLSPAEAAAEQLAQKENPGLPYAGMTEAQRSRFRAQAHGLAQAAVLDGDVALLGSGVRVKVGRKS